MLLPLSKAEVNAETYADLQNQLPAVASADNAWLLVQELPARVIRQGRSPGDLVVLPARATESRSLGVNLSVLGEFKADNAKLIEMVGKIVQLPGWSSEKEFNRDQAKRVSALTFGVETLLADAVAKAESGEVEGSWREALEFMQFSQRIHRSGSVTIHAAVGFGLMNMGANYACWIGQMNSDAVALKRYAKELVPFEGLGETVLRVLRTEFGWMMTMIDECQHGGEPLKRLLVERMAAEEELAGMLSHFSNKDGSPQLSDKLWPKYPREENIAKWMKAPPPSITEQMEVAKTLDYKTLREEFAEQLRNELKCEATTWKEYRTLYPTRKVKPAKVSSGPDLQVMLSSSNSDSAGILRRCVFQQIAQVRLVRVALSMKAWALEHGGKLPENLSELVPAYLPSLPADPFDGGPLRFDKTTRRVWSVGPDLENRGKSMDEIEQVVLD